MQSKKIARMGKKIRSLRDRGVRWREVCLQFDPPIVTAEGKPDTGLASLIAYQDFQPGKEVCQRLGIRPMCTKCNRLYPVARANGHIKHELSAAEIWWNGLSAKDRLEYKWQLYIEHQGEPLS